MKKAILVVLALTMCTTAFPQQTTSGVGRRRPARQGEAAGYSSRDATVLSMMGWGVGLAVAFAAICVLIEDSDGSGGGGHNNGH